MIAPRWIRTAVLTALLALPLQASASTIFVANGSDTLYTLDDSSAAPAAVGAGGFNLFELAFHPDGTLWAIGAPTTGGAQRLLTLDTATGAASQVTASVSFVGNNGPRDMTFGSDGKLYVGHHRHNGSGSGLGVYEASILDGTAGDFIFARRGGVPIGTLANGDLFALEYTSLLNVTPVASATVQDNSSLVAPSGGTTCRFPQPDEAPGPSISGYKVLAVDNAPAGVPIAWTNDPGTGELCRIDIGTGEITSIGGHGLGALTGIAVQPVPEPAAAMLVGLAAMVLAIRRS